MRDGTPVGQVRASMFVPAGYVKCEGATVNRSNYPRLVALANKYSLWTSDTANNPGKFGQGNGSTTMVLPNLPGRVLQFASTAGGKVDAGLPDIIGYIGRVFVAENGSNGCIIMQLQNQGAYRITGLAASDITADSLIYASRSNSIYGSSTTVQPPAINIFAIMRY